MCTRWYGGLFISASRRTGRAKALSLSDVTNAAFNAQPLRLVIIIAVGNARAQALSLSLSQVALSIPFSRPVRNRKRPFHRVSPSYGLQAPTWCALLYSPSPFLSLSFSLSLWTRWFIHSVNRGPGRQVSVIVSRVGRVWKKKKERVPDWVWIRGSLCWFSTKSIAPKDGTHCFISNESVTLSVRPTRDCLELFISVSTLCFLNLSSI